MAIMMMELILYVKVHYYYHVIIECHYSCFKCMGSSTNCELCSDVSKRILDSSLLSCNCIQGYYDDGVEICK